MTQHATPATSEVTPAPQSSAQCTPPVLASSSNSLNECLQFLTNVISVQKRCIINYDCKINRDEIPSEFRFIVDSTPVESVNGEEISKFINDDDKMVRRKFVDYIKQNYLIPIIELIKLDGTYLTSKNAAWKTRDSFYAMYRCNCKSMRLLDREGNLLFTDDEENNGPGGDTKNGRSANGQHLKLKYPNVTSITDVMNMWIDEHKGVTINFELSKSNKAVIDSNNIKNKDEKSQFLKDFKHLEAPDIHSSIDFLKHDDKYDIKGSCPGYLSFAFKLSSLEFKLKIRYFPHDEKVPLKITTRRKLNNNTTTPEPALKKLKLSAKPAVEPPVVHDNSKMMDIKFLNNDP